MPITPVDKVKIIKYLKETPVGSIAYYDLCDALCKRGKISDVEFLEFFVESVVKEFRKDEKISMKQVTKFVATIIDFLHWVYDEGSFVEEKILDSIRSLEDYYDDYLNRTNFDIDLEFTDGVLADVLKTVDELYPCEKKNESILQYLNQIGDLSRELTAVRKELESLTGRFDSLSSDYDIKSQSLVARNIELTKANQEVANRDRIIDELNARVSELSSKIEELQGLLGQSKEERDELFPYKEKCSLLSKEVEELNDALKSIEKQKNEALMHRVNETTMEGLIYQKLLEGSNIEGLISYVNGCGFKINRQDLYGLLSRIKTRIAVDGSSFGISPNYKIVEPRVLEDGIFDIGVPVGCTCYDILLTADYHTTEITSKYISEIDRVNSYCVNNNIKLVVNLGDFFDGVASKEVTFDDAIQRYKWVEQAISLIPKADGIYHAVLGGNHDKRFLKYGFDPIEMMAREREDIINLGYTHSTITLNGCRSFASCFDIHHPTNTNFPIKLNEEGMDSELLLDYLNRSYERQGRTRNDSYIDIFGHTHKSQFNYVDSYAFIPSLLANKSKKGACHLKIYLDENSLIKYMVFIPLSISDNYSKTTEIIYQKVLNR